jgi:hypothetical protein
MFWAASAVRCGRADWPSQLSGPPGATALSLNKCFIFDRSILAARPSPFSTSRAPILSLSKAHPQTGFVWHNQLSLPNGHSHNSDTARWNSVLLLFALSLLLFFSSFPSLSFSSLLPIPLSYCPSPSGRQTLRPGASLQLSLPRRLLLCCFSFHCFFSIIFPFLNVAFGSLFS